MAEARSTLLICTVGGSAEPVVAALNYWQPVRVLFVHTPQTKAYIEAEIVLKARDEGVDLDAGRYDLFELPDGQDLASCLDRLQELNEEVERWTHRGAGYQVVVDFTGGTKCMSAAAALQARRWPCLFSYVGGSGRTKDGVGVVISGAEKVVHQANPWDALGYQAVEDFVALFDQHAFRAAAHIAGTAKKRVSRPDRKREFAVLERLASGFDAWDRFDHKTSKASLEDIDKCANDLRAVVGQARGNAVLAALRQSRTFLEEMCRAAHPGRPHILDLLTNARRRKQEGRLDDAMARLYRAIEALGQVALRERHGIENTGSVPLERVPGTLRQAWAARASEGHVKLGLQDVFELLASLRDPLGQRFHDAGLGGQSSPLVARNQSILAHGFQPVGDSVLEKLWPVALSLADLDEASLPSFPTLGERGEH